MNLGISNVTQLTKNMIANNIENKVHNIDKKIVEN